MLLICSLSIFCSLSAQIREEHLWKDRLLLLFAADDQSRDFTRQINLLTEAKAEVTERDLKTYRIHPDHAVHPSGKTLSANFSKRLYEKYEIGQEVGFAILLIGKDGTEKLRAREVVPPQRIFRLIDSMPMRQREMRERQ